MGWWAQERPLLRCERSAITRTEIRFVTSDTFGCNVLSYVAQRRGSRLIRNCLDSTNVVERADEGSRAHLWWPVGGSAVRPGNAELMEVRVHQRRLT